MVFVETVSVAVAVIPNASMLSAAVRVASVPTSVAAVKLAVVPRLVSVVCDALCCQLHAQGLQQRGEGKRDSGNNWMWRLHLEASCQELPQLWHNKTR